MDAPLSGAPLTHPTSISQIRSEFDAFLYASIEERSDQPLLSVISALARRDVDPWQEAAELSHMSRDGATSRLAALIETLPSDPSAPLNCRAAATRLVALLPQRAVISVLPRGAMSPMGVPANVRAVMAIVVLNALFMALFFGLQYIAANVPPTAKAAQAQSRAINNIKPDTTSRDLTSHNRQKP